MKTVLKHVIKIAITLPFMFGFDEAVPELLRAFLFAVGIPMFALFSFEAVVELMFHATKNKEFYDSDL